MSRRTTVALVGFVAVVVISVIGWFLLSPLFITNAVDEAFPFELPAELATMSATEMQALEQDFMAALPDETTIAKLSDEERGAVTDNIMRAAAAVMSDKEMSDSMPEDEWQLLAAGSFVDADSFHRGSGQASVFQQGEQRILRLEDFEVTNGPDLHVILSSNPQPSSRSDIGDDYIDLGSLKGNKGNQNYELNTDIVLADYQSVVIYCMPFHVVFSTASLN